MYSALRGPKVHVFSCVAFLVNLFRHRSARLCKASQHVRWLGWQFSLAWMAVLYAQTLSSAGLDRNWAYFSSAGKGGYLQVLKHLGYKPRAAEATEQFNFLKT